MTGLNNENYVLAQGTDTWRQWEIQSGNIDDEDEDDNQTSGGSQDKIEKAEKNGEGGKGGEISPQTADHAPVLFWCMMVLIFGGAASGIYPGLFHKK